MINAGSCGGGRAAPIWVSGKSGEALRDSDQPFRLPIDAIPALVWCAAPSGKPFYFNRRMLAYFGLRREDVRHYLEMVHPNDVVAVRRSWHRCVERAEHFVSVHRLRRADGAYRWHEARAEPWRDQAGAIGQWCGANVDLDEAKRTEQTLRSDHARVLRVSRLASLAERSASIAHEINQPLAAVVTNGHACQRWLAAEPPNVQRARVTTERIIREATSAAEIVDRIRALFKKVSVSRITANINEVIIQACRLMTNEVSVKKVSIETDLERDMPSVLIDCVQLRQVVVNLVRNAIEAMTSTVDEQRLLVIRSRREGTNEVRVEVQDHGSGVEDTERIFEPFYSTKEDGMGIGLSICRSIVEAHDGRLWATREEPKGTMLGFTLPRCPSAP
jgi:PAS domain S-box-containing protein